MSGQEFRYLNSRASGHTAVLAAWKRVCSVTGCGLGNREEKENVRCRQTQVRVHSGWHLITGTVNIFLG